MEGPPLSNAWQTCSSPSTRFSKWGWLPFYLFARLRARRMPRGISSPTGRASSEERMQRAEPFVGERFGHGRVAGSSRNVSRAYRRQSGEPADDVRVDARTGGTADLRGVDCAL